jgi:SAM-dependent methyltransferase
VDALDFYRALKVAFDKENRVNQPVLQEVSQYFRNELDKIMTCDKTDNCLKMTQASVLFEGFYSHLDIIEFKKILTEIRVKKWQRHFGTPTLTFLLTYKHQIDQTKQLFDELNHLKISDRNVPWRINKKKGFVMDQDSGVLIDLESISRVAAPAYREMTGVFTKTHNPIGGFTTTACDSISQQFIEHAVLVSRKKGRVLEIGAAFGAATLEAVARGATVFCNDIHSDNLAVVRKRFLETTEGQELSITGDSTQLILIPGKFPDELAGLPEKSFEAILICRVLHFFTGKKIEESLEQMAKLLAPYGKIYIVCETPYLKNWQQFIPEFNKRVAGKVEWPGEITTPAKYESSGRVVSLPKFVHWMTKEILERSLIRTGFSIERSIYINRAGQFPDDLLLPEYGKESVGAIGIVR